MLSLTALWENLFPALLLACGAAGNPWSSLPCRSIPLISALVITWPSPLVLKEHMSYWMD